MSASKNDSLIVEIWKFIKFHKLWFIIPVVVSVVIVGLVVIVAQSGLLTPFIYVLF